MPLLAPPVDYNALRVALVAAVQAATGLDDNHVIMAEPEQPDAPRPSLPYVTLKMTTVGTMSYAASWVDQDGTLNSTAQRSMVVSVNTYGTSHEDAYNTMASIQAGFDMMPIQEMLRAGGLAVWQLGTALDLSLLLDTGYEGRAQMDVTMGFASNAQFANVDYIASSNVEIQLDNADPTLVDIVTGAP